MRKLLSLGLGIVILFCLCASKNNEEATKSEMNNTQVIEASKVDQEKIAEEAKIKEEAKAKEEDKAKEEAKAKEETKAKEDAEAEAKEKAKAKEEAKVKKENSTSKIVVIDPGHGAGGNKEKERQSPDSDIMKIKDPGGAQGISTGVPEYVVAMKVSLKLKALLEQNNIKVIMTKTENNVSPGNIERAETGNSNNADLAIRIHCDSADAQSAHGASMLVPAAAGYAKDISAISKRYGQVILKDLVAEAGMYNRGVTERSDLTGFNWSKVPVVLVELGFMSNIDEDNLLNNVAYEDKLAKGLCNGIIEALNNN